MFWVGREGVKILVFEGSALPVLFEELDFGLPLFRFWFAAFLYEIAWFAVSATRNN